MTRLVHATVKSTLAGLALAAWACATNPVTGERQFTVISEGQEVQIGQAADAELRQSLGVYEDDELQGYIEGIGNRLAQSSERPHLPWKFGVVDSPAVNAMALPGGPVYVTRGMLAYLNDEAELAGVMGHEVGHVTARHAVQQASKGTAAQLGIVLASIFFPEAAPYGDLAGTGLSLLFLKHGRDAERQSDRLGARYAAANGWDPEGVVDMLRTLSRLSETSDRKGVPNWLSTHPEPASRVDEMTPVVADLRAQQPGEPARNRDEYLARVDGVIYGDNPSEGIVRGNEFLHPELRFALEFPIEWAVANAPTQVVSQAPDGRAAIILQLVPTPRGGSLGQVAESSMRQAGFRSRGGRAARINDLEAYVGTWEGNVQGLGRSLARAAVIASEGRVYRIIGVAAEQLFERVAGDFDRTIGSFRALSRGEASEIRPNRIALYRAREGDTWQGIAQGPSQGIVSAQVLALMNGYAVNEQPRPGERLKIVRAGS